MSQGSAIEAVNECHSQSRLFVEDNMHVRVGVKQTNSWAVFITLRIIISVSPQFISAMNPCKSFFQSDEMFFINHKPIIEQHFSI